MKEIIRQIAIMKLVEDCVNAILNDSDYGRNIAREGHKGFEKMTNEELADAYGEAFEEEVTIID